MKQPQFQVTGEASPVKMLKIAQSSINFEDLPA